MEIERSNERSWDTNLRLVEEIYTAFDDLGLSTVAASRIGAYRSAFRRLMAAAEEGSFTQPDAERVLGTLVDFHELRRIVAAVGKSNRAEEWSERLEQLVSGKPFPQEPEDRSTGRDFQFECFVAAVCELSDLEVVFEEPDLRVVYAGRTIAIAAKRPRRRQGVKRNLKKGIKQMAQSGLPGIVAVDLSTALYSGKCINTNDVTGATLFVKKFADEAIFKYGREIGGYGAADQTFGVLAHLHLPFLNFGHTMGPQVGAAVRWTFGHLLEEPEEWSDWVNGFLATCDVGLLKPLPGDKVEGEGNWRGQRNAGDRPSGGQGGEMT